MQTAIQKQLRTMPGQEKMVQEYYQKNPSALASLRGNVYEEKIINLIKSKAKVNKKEVSKEEAEKILKSAPNYSREHKHNDSHEQSKTKKTVSAKKTDKSQKAKPLSKKLGKAKKVSKK